MASSIRGKVESAVAQLLTAAGVSPVYQGFAGTDKAGTCVIAKARRAEEEPQESGNYKVTVDVFVKGPPDTDGAFDTLADAVRDALWRTDLAAQLQSYETTFTVWGATAPHVMEWTEDGDLWIETQIIELYCAALTP